LSNFLTFSLEHNELNQNEVKSSLLRPSKNLDHLSESVFGNALESVPVLISQKMQIRFSCRLKYLLDKFA